MKTGRHPARPCAEERRHPAGARDVHGLGCTGRIGRSLRSRPDPVGSARTEERCLDRGRDLGDFAGAELVEAHQGRRRVLELLHAWQQDVDAGGVDDGAPITVQGATRQVAREVATVVPGAQRELLLRAQLSVLGFSIR
jgi:hypothetical protein